MMCVVVAENNMPSDDMNEKSYERRKWGVVSLELMF